MHRFAAALTIGVVIGVVIAVLPVFVSLNGTQAPRSNSPGPGLPSLEAYNQMRSNVETTPGGPWGLVSMVGIVASSPAAPFGQGLDRCQMLPGPTVWNLSAIPSLSTSLWGGRTLLWQSVFLNDTFAMLFTSDIDGRVIVDGPYGPTTACVALLEAAPGGLLGVYPRSYWLPNGTLAQNLASAVEGLNSTAWSPTAARHLGNVSFSAWGGGVAYYILGYSWLNAVQWTDNGWGVWYQVCGLTGRAGQLPYSFTEWELGDSPSAYYGSVEGSLSCPVASDASFDVNYNQTSSWNGTSGAGIKEQLRLGVGSGGTFFYFDTANSLVSWMTKVTLTSTGGVPLLPTGQQCPINATSLDECTAPAEAWYAALLSPDGYLLDTFPTTAGGTQWQAPNVFVTNNDTLAIVSASSLVGSGDVLSITPAYSFPQVLGNATL
jgi:hypothetical protein